MTACIVETASTLGFVKFFNPDKKFGFVDIGTEKDVHIGLKGAEYGKRLADGVEVRIAYMNEGRGPTVTDVEEFPWHQGTVRFFNAAKKFGFIKCDDFDRDVFVHISVAKKGQVKLIEGMQVDFRCRRDDRGLTAYAVRTVKAVEQPVASVEVSEQPTPALVEEILDEPADDGRPAPKRRKKPRAEKPKGRSRRMNGTPVLDQPAA